MLRNLRTDGRPHENEMFYAIYVHTASKPHTVYNCDYSWGER